MHIPQIATRIVPAQHHQPGDVGLVHPYRRRWWLPVIGPTATVLLDHLSAAAADASDWVIHDTTELATSIGLGARTGLHSPLIKAFERICHFGFGSFDIAPDDPMADPCITLWATIGLVPECITQRWPESLQAAHAIDLAELHRTAA